MPAMPPAEPPGKVLPGSVQPYSGQSRVPPCETGGPAARAWCRHPDRKSTRLNSSHVAISYAVFCLKKKKNKQKQFHLLNTPTHNFANADRVALQQVFFRHAHEVIFR